MTTPTPKPRVYPNFVRQTLKGGLPGGEVFSLSLSFANATGSPANEGALQAFGDSSRTAWQAWMANTDTRLGTGVFATSVETRSITPDGKTQFLAVSAANFGSGGVSLTMPNQCAVVVGLQTNRAGARFRGRIYVPMLGALVGTTGRLQPGLAQNLVNTTKTLFDSLNTAAAGLDDDSLFRLSVVSSVAGEHKEVSAIRVGDVIDTQRRRRDALPESYVGTALALGGG